VTGEWEKPLYEIVNGFRLIIWPILNLVEVTTAMISFFSAVKPDDPSVHNGKISRNKLALNSTDWENFTTHFPNYRRP